MDPPLAFVQAIVWLVIVGEAAFLLFILMFAPEQMHRAVGPVSMLLVSLAALYFLWRKKMTSALLCMGIGFWVSITLVVLLNGGIRAPLAYAYPLVIVMVGWLIGARAAIFFAVMTCMVIAAMVYGESAGWFPRKELAPAVLFGNTLFFVCILAAGLINLLVRAYQKQLTEVNAVSKRFQTAFRSSPAASSIATVDEGRVLELNDNFVRDYGWTREECR